MKNEIEISNVFITEKIKVIRGQKIILDSDLAQLFGVETKRLKEQIRRNRERFPEAFMFELTQEENNIIRNNGKTLERGKYSKYRSFAFTEHGVLMASNILKSKMAIKMSIQIIETFVALMKLANNYKDLVDQLQTIESKYNKQFIHIYEILEKLTETPKKLARKKIGFQK